MQCVRICAPILVAALMILVTLPTFVSRMHTNAIDFGQELGNGFPAIIYVVGPEPDGLRSLASSLGKVAIIRIPTLSKVPDTRGIIIVTRTLSKNEKTVLKQALEEGFVVLVLNDDARKQVDEVLHRLATFTATFNGTHVYLYRLMTSTTVGNRHPLFLKGYAGSRLSLEVLRDAIKVFNLEIKDWRVVGVVEWDSGDIWRPYGRLVVEHLVYIYPNDPWNDMDLFAVKCTTRIVSGNALGWNDDPHYVWWNDYVESRYLLTYYSNVFDLRDYDPTSREGGGSITVSITVPPALVLTWTYNGNYIVSINDESDLGREVAGWFHDIGTWYSPAVPNTIKIAPGFVFTVSPPVTAKQRWVISGGWRAAATNPTYPPKFFRGTVVIDVTFLYS